MLDIDSQSILAMNPAASYQPAGDGAVILRIGDGQLFTCNATSEAFLRHVDGSRTLGVIAAVICDEFAADIATVTDDLIVIARELVDEGILRLVG